MIDSGAVGLSLILWSNPDLAGENYLASSSENMKACLLNLISIVASVLTFVSSCCASAICWAIVVFRSLIILSFVLIVCILSLGPRTQAFG